MKPRSNSRDWQTRLRVWAAIIMGIYQILLMGYYSTGVFSTELMEDYGAFLGTVWFLQDLFFLALTVHIALGLWKLFRRNTLKMPLWELTQIVLGLTLPFLMFPNNAATLSLTWFLGVSPNYVDTILLTFPNVAWRYVTLATIIGIHAYIGTHNILKIRPWYPRFRVLIVLPFLVLPVMAASGYLKGGTELYHELLTGQLSPLPHVLTAAQKAYVDQIDLGVYLFFTGLYILLFAGRSLRLRLQQKNRTVQVRYPGGGSVMVFPQTTLLEASRIGNFPHASVCGGRGRCTTCRVRVDEGMENLSAVAERESRALKRIGVPQDIRLACQAECLHGSVQITPLLPENIRSAGARSENRDSVGRDVEMAVLFADLQGFTNLSEGKFPYDVVYILNSYFQEMGQVIENQGGKIDKFLGDGILAFFGLDRDSRESCRGAILAAIEMVRKLPEVNKKLSHILPNGLTIRIGIHFGDVLWGEIGYQDKKHMTIIGDTVNTASRLENLNKKTSSQLILSTITAAKAGFDLSHLPVASVTLRGKTSPLRVFVVKDVLKTLHELG